jgi:hypothetical protein
MIPMEKGWQWLTASKAIIAYTRSNPRVNQFYFIPDGVNQAMFKISENMGGKEVRYKLPTGIKDTLQLGKKSTKYQTRTSCLPLQSPSSTISTLEISSSLHIC